MKPLILILAAASLFAAEAPKPPEKPLPPPPVVLSETDRLKFENLAYRQEIARRDQAELIRTVCETAKIPVQECSIDPSKGTVNRVPSK